jgi:hypothetical protein
MKPGEITVSFEYRRQAGPRVVHGSVTLQFSNGSSFRFRSQVRWPHNDDYTNTVEGAVREVLSERHALESTTCTLLRIEWDEVGSCQAGFAAAARAATRAAFEV